MIHMKDSYRIRWEDIPFALSALGTEIFLFFLNFSKEQLYLADPFFNFVVKYGCYIGLVLLVPSMLYFIYDFILSIKIKKLYIKIRERNKIEEKKEEEFNLFYEKYFNKKGE